MKKFIVGALILLLAMNADAQWYNNKYSVNDINDLNVEQLRFSLDKAESNIKTGKILTLTGLGVGIIGAVVSGSVWGKAIPLIYPGEYDNYMAKATTGGFLVLGGAGAMAVGIPLWAVNASRRNKIELSLAKFNTTSFLGNNQPTYLGFKQSTTLGMSVKIHF